MIELTADQIRPFLSHTFPKNSIPQLINYHCAECGKNMEGCVRIQNDRLGYVKCLRCGLGVERRRSQP
jgi:DNA-directed RNA polymerase subunit RPC12/RpoP